MDQLKKLFAALSLQQKIMLVLAVVIVAAGVPMLTRWQHERAFRPLFTGMAPEDGAAVVQKLKEGGTEHRLADNGSTVLVPVEKVDEARLDLAGAGLPKTGRIGFEIFDKTNIGLTDFSEHVNYRRALEGELERTMKALNGIEQARVHISFPKDSVFLDSREAAKASVLVSLRPGAGLTPQNVRAITNLVASAVEGLSPESVSVVDMQGNLLNRPHKPADGTDSAEGILEYKHQVEKDLTAKVEATLEPLLGEGNFRVGISADCDFSTSEQTDETYDPTRSVMATSQKTEDLSSAGGVGGVPGTPSNLPRSTIKPMGGVSGGVGGVSRRAENVSFETSRTIKQVKVPRGSIKRISAALLLDQGLQWQGKGAQRRRVSLPPTPEKLKAIHDIVAGVLGLTTERGDQLVVESLPFEQTRALEESLNSPTGQNDKSRAPAKFYEDKRLLLGGGGLALLALALLAFLLLRKRKPVEAFVEQAKTLAPGTAAAVAQVEAAEVPTSASVSRILPVMTSKTQLLLTELKENVGKDPTFAVNIVRSWLED
jgi:flagellar M-ring protein FliF